MDLIEGIIAMDVLHLNEPLLSILHNNPEIRRSKPLCAVDHPVVLALKEGNFRD